MQAPEKHAALRRLLSLHVVAHEAIGYSTASRRACLNPRLVRWALLSHSAVGFFSCLDQESGRPIDLQAGESIGFGLADERES